jgi:hypothetical protein
VRRLIEDTPLTYGEIAARTGVARASICRWTRDGSWRRHAFAPRATDTVPRARASARLKRRTLAARLDALAERAIRELEASASVDLDKLGEALELLKMARLAARPRRRRGRQTPFVPARGTPSRERDGDPVAGTQEPRAHEQPAPSALIGGNLPIVCFTVFAFRCRFGRASAIGPNLDANSTSRRLIWGTPKSEQSTTSCETS